MFHLSDIPGGCLGRWLPLRCLSFDADNGLAAASNDSCFLLCIYTLASFAPFARSIRGSPRKARAPSMTWCSRAATRLIVPDKAQGSGRRGC